jgi:hypothetical protein
MHLQGYVSHILILFVLLGKKRSGWERNDCSQPIKKAEFKLLLI